jgi:hypothetical protein
MKVSIDQKCLAFKYIKESVMISSDTKAKRSKLILNWWHVDINEIESFFNIFRYFCKCIIAIGFCQDACKGS